MSTKIEFTRVNNDTSGNPRYVCHFSNLLTNQESRDYSGEFLNRQYNLALQRAKTIGGRKFHNQKYGGGIVFKSYNIASTENKILELLKQIYY